MVTRRTSIVRYAPEISATKYIVRLPRADWRKYRARQRILSGRCMSNFANSNREYRRHSRVMHVTRRANNQFENSTGDAGQNAHRYVQELRNPSTALGAATRCGLLHLTNFNNVPAAPGYHARNRFVIEAREMNSPGLQRDARNFTGGRRLAIPRPRVGDLVIFKRFKVATEIRARSIVVRLRVRASSPTETDTRR